jgi:hypothetical protein
VPCADTTNAANVACNFDDGTNGDTEAPTVVGPGVQSGDSIFGTAGSLSLNSALALKSAATVAVECDGGGPGEVRATATMTAARVGALTSSGDPTFGLQEVRHLRKR